MQSIIKNTFDTLSNILNKYYDLKTTDKINYAHPFKDGKVIYVKFHSSAMTVIACFTDIDEKVDKDIFMDIVNTVVEPNKSTQNVYILIICKNSVGTLKGYIDKENSKYSSLKLREIKYHQIAIDLTQHRFASSDVEIIPKNSKKLLEYENTKIFPQIKTTDPLVIQLNVQVGDVLLFKKKTDTGLFYCYRLVS